MPQKNCLCQETCVLSWLFQAFLLYYYFVPPLMQCHRTWKKIIHTKNVFWNGLFKLLLVTVNNNTKKIKRQVKRNSWTTWLRDQASKTCVFCLAFLADAAQVTRSSKMRGQVQVWQMLVNLGLGLPGCIWTKLLGVSQHQPGFAGKEGSFWLICFVCSALLVSLVFSTTSIWTGHMGKLGFLQARISGHSPGKLPSGRFL